MKLTVSCFLKLIPYKSMTILTNISFINFVGLNASLTLTDCLTLTQVFSAQTKNLMRHAKKEIFGNMMKSLGNVEVRLFEA